ncbi:hypothetical protein NLI96_g13290 [Meripilus lineatus]|uniref:Helicase C-terminal domain-containing protein n=1 Tax=Meripilus lineatus TaxID=2056292 RepID=A0AAD5UPQ2_9APHY|nr:hypothetical protein NLI96_g13290 [Physisporinus lineatus]
MGVPSDVSFHLAFRRCLTHPICNSSLISDEDVPKTVEAWREKPSRKLDTLVLICLHHLNQDNAVPLTIHPDNQTLVEDSSYVPPELPEYDLRGAKLGPDKIIIYSAFPSNLQFIGGVIKTLGIDYYWIDGRNSTTSRTQVLRQFRHSDRDGIRVLIVSNIGITGLNLDCANIIINLDVLWSALEDQQLIGRAWRYPQVKPVRVYRLVGMKTPDVFLNNISFEKGALQDAFVGSTPHLSSRSLPQRD